MRKIEKEKIKLKAHFGKSAKFIQLIYFNSRGDYEGTGLLRTECKTLEDLIEEVKWKRKKRELPGTAESSLNVMINSSPPFLLKEKN